MHNQNGSTPLHVAARYGNKEAMKVLISKGANVHSQDQNGRTPLDVCDDPTTTQHIKNYVKVRDIKRKLITRRLYNDNDLPVEEIFNNIHSMSDLNNYIKACLSQHKDQDGDQIIKRLDEIIRTEQMCNDENHKQLLDKLKENILGRPSPFFSMLDEVEECKNDLQIGC